METKNPFAVKASPRHPDVKGLPLVNLVKGDILDGSVIGVGA
jgi:hypothetical protein